MPWSGGPPANRRLDYPSSPFSATPTIGSRLYEPLADLILSTTCPQPETTITAYSWLYSRYLPFSDSSTRDDLSQILTCFAQLLIDPHSPAMRESAKWMRRSRRSRMLLRDPLLVHKSRSLVRTKRHVGSRKTSVLLRLAYSMNEWLTRSARICRVTVCPSVHSKCKQQ